MDRHIMQYRPHIPKSPSGIERIVSGGQTGADRAGLDVAIRHGIPHGGWCPKGRRAETGRIPARYRLKETPRPTYVQRTEWNVRDSDGTAIFTVRPDLRAGSRRTQEFARQTGKPFIHIPLTGTYQPALDLLKFITAHKIQTLNVAGSRESQEPGIASWVEGVLEDALFWSSPGTLLSGLDEG